MADKLKLLIVIYHPFELWRAPQWFAERVAKDFPNVDVIRLDDYKRVDQEMLDTDVLMSWSITPQQVAAAKKLRWIHSPAAAVHRLMIPELMASDIMVTSAREVHGPVVAEHVMALVFALAKRLPSAMRCQASKQWGQALLWSERPRPRELAGATLGIVGVGSIGREVARLASAVGMRVVAARKTVTTEGTEKHGGRTLTTKDTKVHEGEQEVPRLGLGPSLGMTDRSEMTEIEKVFGPDEIEEMLSQSDFVVLAAPVTPETKGMMNAARLAAMKRDAYLINVGRGALIDEAALVAALREGRIGGAALDVFEQEPLAQESPFWEMENVLITPHSAALTERLWDRHFELLSENLRRFQAGKPLRGSVDKGRGY